MKKLLFLLIIITLVSCNNSSFQYKLDQYELEKNKNAMYGWEYLDSNIKFRTIKIDDHEYLLFSDRGKSYGKSIFILHSESCPCKKKKK